MLLQSLVNGKEQTACILIEDDLDHSGSSCLRTFITSFSERYDSVLVFLTETRPEAFSKSLPHQILSKLHILDGASNPQGWQESQPPPPHPQVTMDTDICSRILSDRRLKGEVGVVIDSLDDLLLHRSATYTCQTLHRLSHHDDQVSNNFQIKQVISLVHADLHSNGTLQLLRHTATSCLRMSQPKDPTNYSHASRILHKRVSGKILRSEEQYTLSDELTICDIAEVLHLKAPQAPATAPDPTANLTFNLSLSNQEREARSQLVLPYIRKQDKKEELGSSSAKIFYQPDEADDFDEEDPDDDLDI